jgi:hypothetical protein
MTIDEKALALIEKWEAGTYYGGAVQKRAALQSAIVEALRDQDGETRFACAELAMPLVGRNNLHVLFLKAKAV